MDEATTEYIWHYNPVTGRVAGANQNYGARINILQTNRHLFRRMQEVQRRRNEIVQQRGLNSIAGGSVFQYIPSYETTDLEEDFDGGSFEPDIEPDTINLRELADKIQPRRVEEVTTKLTTKRFVTEFPPIVYSNPFNGPNFPAEFNHLYSPSGNEFTSQRFANLNGGAISIAGFHPKLSGSGLVLRGEDPVLG